jgi:hypothetical protein
MAISDGGKLSVNVCAAKIDFEYIPSTNETIASHEYAAYPLKFLHPRSMLLPGFSTHVTVGNHPSVDVTQVFLVVRAWLWRRVSFKRFHNDQNHSWSSYFGYT